MKEITTDKAAWIKLQKGINQLANTVGLTLGPGGANIILEKPGSMYQISKDGFTVARDIGLPDVLENLGAHLVKEAASKTVDSAGDGTTSSTILAQAIFNAGLKKVIPRWPWMKGAQRSHIKRGIEAAVKDVVANLKALSQPIETGDVFKIAKISSNGDDAIATLINDSLGRVGKDGMVSVEDTHGVDSFVKIVEGVQFDRGYLSPYFVSDQAKMMAGLKNAEVLIVDGSIEKFREQLLPLLEKRKKRGYDRPLLIIADAVIGEALATLAFNHHNGNMACCAVESPDFGDSRKEVIKDFAALTGAKVISKEIGLKLENAGLDVLGTAQRVQVSQWTTTIIEGGGKKEAIDARVEVIRRQLDDANPQAQVKLKDRLARLLNGMAVVYVGGTTEIEIREKKDRIDDALNATKAALDEGVVAGGGIALVRVHERMKDGVAKTIGRSVLANSRNGLSKDECIGYDILVDALKIPFLTIVSNVEEDPAKAYAKVIKSLNPAYGFNAKTRVYEDLIVAGVIDPTKVTRLALENAASVAGMLLSTKAVVSFLKTK